MSDPFVQRLNKYQKQKIDSVVKEREKFSVSLRKSKRNFMTKQLRNNIKVQENILNSAFHLTRPSDNLISFFPDLQNAGSELEKLKIYSDILKYPEIPEHFIQEILTILAQSISTTHPELNPRPYFERNGIPEAVMAIIQDSKDIPVLTQAVFCLTNFLAGPENYTGLVSQNILGRLVQLMDFKDDELTDNILYLLGNMIIDNAEVCEIILDLRILLKMSDLDFSKRIPGHSASFLLSSMTTHAEKMSLVQCASILKFFEELADSEKELILLGLSFITNKRTDFMSLVLNSEKLSQLVINSLTIPGKISTHGLRIVVNFSTGSKQEEDFLMENKCLDVFYSILKKVREDELKMIYFTLSNLSCGSFQVRCMVSTHPIIMENEFAFTHSSEKVRCEVSNFYSKVLKFSPVELKINLIENGIFFNVCHNFETKNIEILLNCILISGYLLAVEKFALLDVPEIFKESGCFEKVQELALCNFSDVAKAANDLLSTYFN
jgi:hypothetical protein